MNYIFKSRGFGKTSDLVKLCYENNGIILVNSNAQKSYIHECLCPKMNIPPEKVRVEIYGKMSRGIFSQSTPIYVDEFQYVLERALGLKIDTIAGTLE